MKVAIMQPYLFPYIGYFQLINAVDKFVVYDNIQFTKKGWINRNRILVNKKDEYFTVPLKKDSDYLDIVQRELAVNSREERAKILRKITEAYRKAPHFQPVFQLVQDVFNQEEDNLFRFIYYSLMQTCSYLQLNTELIISSSLAVDPSLRSQAKVLAICQAIQADTYINPIGGTELYSKDTFAAHNIELGFIKSDEIVYKQFDHDFIPWLSIIDVMMFNEKEKIKQHLDAFTII